MTFLRKMLRSRHPAQTQQLPGAVCDFKKQLIVGKAKGKMLEKISLGGTQESRIHTGLGTVWVSQFWGAGTACKPISLLPVAIRTSRTPPTPAQV